MYELLSIQPKLLGCTGNIGLFLVLVLEWFLQRQRAYVSPYPFYTEDMVQNSDKARLH